MARNLEDYNPDQNIDQQYIQSYGEDFSVHKLMLSDGPRMDFYAKSIASALSSSSASQSNKNNNNFVIDCGAGSGVLSMIALKNGAKKVYSIEASDRVAQTILPNIKRNYKKLGFLTTAEIKRRWSLHQGMAESFPVEDIMKEMENIVLGKNVAASTSTSAAASASPVREDEEPSKPTNASNQNDENANSTSSSSSSSTPQKVITIYLVSEWMGFYLLHEAMLQSVLHLRDRILKEISSKDTTTTTSGVSFELKLIPDVAEIYCAPFDLRKHYDNSVQPSWQFLDMDFSFLGEVDTADIFSTERNPVVQVINAKSIVETKESEQDHQDSSSSSSSQSLSYRRVLTLDLLTVTIEELEELNFVASFYFPENFGKTNPNTTINGFALWFSCFYVDLDVQVPSQEKEEEKRREELKQNGVLSFFSAKKDVEIFELPTSPFVTPTHWKQTVVMMSDEGIPSDAVAGDTMNAVFTLQRDQRTYLIGLELE